MRIKSLVETTINGIKIYPGVDNYPLDHKDPMTADQLLVLRDTMKKINFGELLYCDLKDFDPKEGPKPFEKMEERTKAYKAQCKEEAELKEKQAEIIRLKRKEQAENGNVRGRTESPVDPPEDGGGHLGGGRVSDEE